MNKKILIVTACFVLLMFALVLIYKIAGLALMPKYAATSNFMDEESALFDRARHFSDQDSLLKAKDIYQRIIEKFPNSKRILKAQGELEDINIRILSSSIPTNDSFLYEVQKGDTLAKIARKFNTTPDLILKANNIKDNIIRYGKSVKVAKAKFSIVVDKSQNILTLKSDQDIVKTYIVSTGKNNSTPTGTFKITNKVVDPPWYPPAGGMIPAGDKRNVLGSRWLGISKQGYGIHGTTQPETIGQGVTEGCVRMKNSDVEELYSILPEGTEVIIID